MKRLFLTFACTVFLFSSLFSQKKTILFLGNSYTAVNNLPQTFYNLSLSGGDSILFDSNAPGGYTFQLHSTNATSLSKINAKPWDFVVLQEQSQIPAFPPQQVATDCYPYAKLLDSLIHVNNACTQTVFYMTWGRKYGDASNCASYPPICTYNGMTGSLRQSYVQMADDNQALVSPCGMAWKASRAADSTINLWSSDNSHPSVAGTYLTACTFYATIFKKSPVGLSYTAALPQQTATFLQQIAHNTVFDSLSTWNINEFTPNAAFSITNDSTYTYHFLNASTHSTSYLWSFGDGTSSTATNSSHIYADTGTYILSLIAYDACTRDTLIDTIHVSNPLLAITPQSRKTVQIYPNPSKDILLIETKENFSEFVLMDINGKIVIKSPFQRQISVERLASGLYFLTLKGEKGDFTCKVVKE